MNKMHDVIEVVSKLETMKSELLSGEISIEEGLQNLSELESIQLKNAEHYSEKNNFLQNLFLTFNISNFCDITLLISHDNEGIGIVERVGNTSLLNNIMFRLKHSNNFYTKYSELVYSSRTYNIYYSEKEETKKYTLLAFSESKYFQKKAFNILSDLTWHYMKTADLKQVPYYSDFFDIAMSRLHLFLEEKKDTKNNIYIFNFQHNKIINEMGVGTAFNLSEYIKSTLSKAFPEDSGIFRISLEKFIVVVPGEESEAFSLNERGNGGLQCQIDFKFNGIVIFYACSQISQRDIATPYDIYARILQGEST